MSMTTSDRELRAIDWLGYFAGPWRMARRIDDRLGARQGEASGEAVFAADPGGADASMICSEALIINYGDRTWHGHQKTVWRFDRPGGPRLFFSDGRFFGELNFAAHAPGWRAEFEHGCGDDIYRGAASVASRNSWRLVWNVTGPRKDYTLDTEYRRIDPDI